MVINQYLLRDNMNREILLNYKNIRTIFIAFFIFPVFVLSQIKDAKNFSSKEIRKDLSGKQITELIDEGKIMIETEGSGIQSVKVKIKKNVTHPVTVIIPVGAFFVSKNNESQNMVITDEIKRTLKNNNWITITIPAACANRPRNVPNDEDVFTIQSTSNQQELELLMKAVKKNKVSYAVKQAAVWIVTDNADYSDLGILVQSYYGYGGTRVIKEDETFQALKLCSQVGINIKSKAIWFDKETIYSGLSKKKQKEFDQWEDSLIEYVVIPDLVDITETEALLIINKLDLVPIILKVAAGDFQKNIVIKQNISKGTKVKTGTNIIIQVGE